MKKIFEKRQMINIKMILISLMVLMVYSCNVKQKELQKNESLFRSTMLKHLNAVSTKDLNTLKSTLSPKGDMILILPNSKVTYSVDEFVKYHEDWFKETNWTFETKILNIKVRENLGIAIVEVMYRESERNGKPYFNRMIVSYDLEKIDNNWYVIKDQSCSIERSTN
jgi:hypothetical protein